MRKSIFSTTTTNNVSKPQKPTGTENNKLQPNNKQTYFASSLRPDESYFGIYIFLIVF